MVSENSTPELVDLEAKLKQPLSSEKYLARELSVRPGSVSLFRETPALFRFALELFTLHPPLVTQRSLRRSCGPRSL